MSVLEGRSILVTRPQGQGDELVESLRELGALVWSAPAIQIEPPSSYANLDVALIGLDRYDWVVFTSVNGLRAVVERMRSLEVPIAHLAAKKIAAIGPATARALEHEVRSPDLVPPEFVSEAISTALEGLRPSRFLLARADIARKHLAVKLREAGHQVDEVEAYRIVRTDSAVDLPDCPPDYITLTSSATVHAVRELLAQQGKEGWFESCALVSIGPITSGTIRELALTVAAQAREYTAEGLVEAIVAHASGGTCSHA